MQYRINLTDSWITVGTYTIGNIGSGVTSFHDQNINIPACEQIEIRCALEAGSSNLTTPQFKQLILA